MLTKSELSKHLPSCLSTSEGESDGLALSNLADKCKSRTAFWAIIRKCSSIRNTTTNASITIRMHITATKNASKSPSTRPIRNMGLVQFTAKSGKTKNQRKTAGKTTCNEETIFTYLAVMNLVKEKSKRVAKNLGSFILNRFRLLEL